MKRFWLFAGEACYYASGGMADFEGDFDTLEQAKAKGYTPVERPSWEGREPEIVTFEWFHIFDSVDRKIVFQLAMAYNQPKLCEDVEEIDTNLPIYIPHGLR